MEGWTLLIMGRKKEWNRRNERTDSLGHSVEVRKGMEG